VARGARRTRTTFLTSSRRLGKKTANSVSQYFGTASIPWQVHFGAQTSPPSTHPDGLPPISNRMHNCLLDQGAFLRSRLPHAATPCLLAWSRFGLKRRAELGGSVAASGQTSQAAERSVRARDHFWSDTATVELNAELGTEFLSGANVTVGGAPSSLAARWSVVLGDAATGEPLCTDTDRTLSAATDMATRSRQASSRALMPGVIMQEGCVTSRAIAPVDVADQVGRRDSTWKHFFALRRLAHLRSPPREMGLRLSALGDVRAVEPNRTRLADRAMRQMTPFGRAPREGAVIRCDRQIVNCRPSRGGVPSNGGMAPYVDLIGLDRRSPRSGQGRRRVRDSRQGLLFACTTKPKPVAPELGVFCREAEGSGTVTS